MAINILLIMRGRLQCSNPEPLLFNFNLYHPVCFRLKQIVLFYVCRQYKVIISGNNSMNHINILPLELDKTIY